MSLEIRADKYAYQAVDLSGNPIAVTVESVDITNTDRAGLRYFVEILRPIGYQAETYEVFRTLTGYETPPLLSDGSFVFKGWTVFIEEYLDAMLKQEYPVFTDGIARHPRSVSSYRTKSWAERDGVVVAGSEVFSPIKYVLKGSMNEDSYALWKNDWYKAGDWLTNMPNWTAFHYDAPILLSFLFNLIPVPLRVNLVVREFKAVGTPRSVRIAGPSVTVGFCELLTFDVSAEQLGIIDPLGLERAEIWLEDDEQRIISTVRTVRFVDNAAENPRALMLCNSLGGWDAVRLSGTGQRQTTVSGEVGERALGSGYMPHSAELFEVNKQGERVLKLLSGTLPKALLMWMEELLWAQLLFVNDRMGWTAIIAKSNVLITEMDAEDIGQRELEFRLAKTGTGYDNRDYIAPAASRPTQWVPSGAYCLVNATGFRSGLLGASQLTLFYTDVNPYERVKGVTQKDNTPGTLGYVPPQANDVCAVGTALFTNGVISRLGTFTKQGCTDGFSGVAATITLAAGEFGGETQLLADQLAEAEWNRRNTQAAANANPSGCLLLIEDYPYTVPAGMVHFRWNVMRLPEAYADMFAVKYPTNGDSAGLLGNAWFVSLNNAGGANTYKAGTNDIDLPANYSTRPWRFGVYVGSVLRNVKIYKNGAVIHEENVSKATSPDGLKYIDVPETQLAAGDRIYVKIT
jgi:hypothetical protein